MQDKPAHKFKGQPAVSFTNEDVSALSSRFSRTIVGRFSKGRPSLISTRKAFERIAFEKDFSVSLLDERHILINFESEKDFLRCLLRKYWKINGFTLKVFRWTPDFDPNADSPLIPVWIGLEGLPIHLFDSLALYSIGNLLGKPLKTDSATTTLSRPSVARICVEIDTSKELPRCVWIHLGELTFLQPITYEDLRDYCPSCKSFGHKNCKRKNETSRWVKGNTGTGNTSTIVAVSKPGVTQTTQEIALQTNLGGSSDENEATMSTSPVKDSNTAGAATPTPLVDAMGTIVTDAIIPATSVSVDSAPNVCDDTDKVEKVFGVILPKSCTTTAYPGVKKVSDGCEVFPTVNSPAACGNSEPILVTMEPNSPIPCNNDHSRSAHNLSFEAALEGTHTIDTCNNKESNSDPSPINLKEFPVLTKELLKATSGEHTLSLEKEMERTLSPSCAGNEEIPSDHMESNNPPPLLTSDESINASTIGTVLQSFEIDGQHYEVRSYIEEGETSHQREETNDFQDVQRRRTKKPAKRPNAPRTIKTRSYDPNLEVGTVSEITRYWPSQKPTTLEKIITTESYSGPFWYVGPVGPIETDGKRPKKVMPRNLSLD
ncbi:unnamed protein product [Cuscuta campestris]|uniref:DUF4283 domain-containing protein n=1 Tax=Cuscuta campestris TaxID=132261 RepID=A0A484N2E1_9ASTE|nr:unnamed protein product [Cuscuta campestris]